MNFQSILTALQHSNPVYRQQAAQILGMAEDVDSLEPLATAFKQETDQDTHLIMKWAGQRLYQAKQNGLTSLDVIFEMFALNQELSGLANPDEERLMQQLQDKLHSDLLQIRQQGTRSKLGWTLAAGLAGGVGGMTLGAVGGMLLSSSHSATYLSDGSGDQRGRIPPMAPTDANYDLWAGRLAAASDSETTITALREMAAFNNPMALILIAEFYYHETDEQLKAAAEGIGKHLYWNMRYWHLTQSGLIEEEFQRRVTARFQEDSTEDSPDAQSKPASPPTTSIKESSPEEIAAILARAEENRKRRRRR